MALRIVVTTRLILLLGEFSRLLQRIINIVKLIAKVRASDLVLSDSLAESERRLNVLVLNVIGDDLLLHDLVLLELARRDVRKGRPKRRLL